MDWSSRSVKKGQFYFGGSAEQHICEDKACFINAAATGRTEATDRKSISCSWCLQQVAATYSLITHGPCQIRPANI